MSRGRSIWMLAALLPSMGLGAPSSPVGCDIRDWPSGDARSAGAYANESYSRFVFLGDVDGDGKGDLATGAWTARETLEEQGAVFLWRGDGRSFELMPSFRWLGGFHEGLGGMLTAPGDVNGDGLADLLFGTSGYYSLTVRAFLYLGDPGGPAPTPAWQLDPADSCDCPLQAVGLGDVNGDGYADVGIVRRADSSGPGLLSVFQGSAAGLAPRPSDVIVMDGGNDEVFGVGDVDGDGFDDVVVGRWAPVTGPGEVLLYPGGPSGLAHSASDIVGGLLDGGRFGIYVSRGGDFNRDGYADVVVSAPGRASTPYIDSTVQVLTGSPSGLARYWTSPSQPGEHAFGTRAVSGDVNGDGHQDVVVGAPLYGLPGYSPFGAVMAYLGTGSGMAAEPALVHVDNFARLPGRELASTGDLDGDGRDDVVVNYSGTMPVPGAAWGFMVVPGAEPNRAPIVSPLRDLVSECGSATAGIDALEPDGDVVSFTWSSDCPDARFLPSADAADVTVAFDFACGRTCGLSVTADDGRCGIVSREARITMEDTAAPRLVGIPADAEVECDSVPPPAHVDAEDDCDSAPSVAFSERREDGPCPQEYNLVRSWTALDACGNLATSHQELRVIDEHAPIVAPDDATRTCLWPPNGRRVRLDAALFTPAAYDNCDPSPSWRLVSCQVDDGVGPRQDADACAIADDGHALLVVATRPGWAREGRRYIAFVESWDACGNVSAPVASGTVLVPHDSRPDRRCRP